MRFFLIMTVACLPMLVDVQADVGRFFVAEGRAGWGRANQKRRGLNTYPKHKKKNSLNTNTKTKKKKKQNNKQKHKKKKQHKQKTKKKKTNKQKKKKQEKHTDT